MEWWLVILIIFGSLILLMATGMPIAIAFLVVTIGGAMLLWGGETGLRQLILNIRDSVTSFILLPVPLFILMGELMFRSGIAPNMINALEKWLGRVPGRLSILAVAAGVLFSTMSGASIASTAMLGELMVPEMEKKGYKKAMSLGPILGSGGLSMMIPPSAMAIVMGAVAEVSIGKLLIAIIIPGLLMAALYAVYIVIRCLLQPSLAPPYDVPPSRLSDKVIDTLRYIVPLVFIIFLVVGVILLGIASPTEAAASGTLGTFILAAAYGKLNWETVKKSFLSATEISVMILLIIVTSNTFSQILAFSGSSSGLIDFFLRLPVPAIGILIGMQVVLLVLGMFVSLVATIFIAAPVFMPVIQALGFDPIWFCVLFLINGEMGGTTPPFGVLLFAAQGVIPGATLEDCTKAALPFLYCDAIAIILIIVFPSLALWLPGLMH